MISLKRLQCRIRTGSGSGGNQAVRVQVQNLDQQEYRVYLIGTEDGANAKGTVAGYYDLEQYLYHTGGLGPVISTGNFSCPAFFEAAKSLADGYPDPETGECTHISSAFEVEAFAAFVVHPDQSREKETAER